MTFVDEVHKVSLASKMVVQPQNVLGPVSMVTAVSVLDNWRNPDGIDSYQRIIAQDNILECDVAQTYFLINNKRDCKLINVFIVVNLINVGPVRTIWPLHHWT